MALSQAQLSQARRLVQEVPDIDTRLPVWAKRNNPIVRRQLGSHWRVFPPELAPILTWFGIQSLIMLISIKFPLVFLLMMIALLIGAVLFPFLLYLYGNTLVQILRDSTHAMASEYEKDTMNVLRATPFSPREIFLSKVATSV